MPVVARSCKREEQDGGEDERRKAKAARGQENKKIRQQKSTGSTGNRSTIALCLSLLPTFPFSIGLQPLIIPSPFTMTQQQGKQRMVQYHEKKELMAS